MKPILCALATCRTLGAHRDGCDTDTCRGCLPRRAADGLNLCEPHTVGIARDAVRAAELHEVLALVLASSDRPGDKTSGSREHGAAINERAVEARTEIRATLVSWCKMIAEERGISLPADTLPAIGAYVALHARWLAAHPAAIDCAEELRELAHGKPWRVAYPTGTRVVEVGVCPQLVDGVRCGGSVRAILRTTDSLLPSELVCDVDGEHRWTAEKWRTFARDIRAEVPRSYTAAEIATVWRRPIGTVHRLASTERWRRVGDGRRPELYRAEDVEATMGRTQVVA